MVDNFNGLQHDFNVLIIECFESGINVSINTVCAQCSELLNTKWTADVSERKVNQHLYITKPDPPQHAPTAAT